MIIIHGLSSSGNLGNVIIIIISGRSNKEGQNQGRAEELISEAGCEDHPASEIQVRRRTKNIFLTLLGLICSQLNSGYKTALNTLYYTSYNYMEYLL